VIRSILAAALLGLGSAAMAADVPPPALTLERVFASPDLSGAQPRQLKLSPDGSLLTMLRNRADERERFDLWAMDTATGVWRMLVDSKEVGSGAALSEAEKMQRERARIGDQRGIVSYAWAPDGKAILVPLDGDLYLAALDGSVRRLTETEGSELNPAISPAGGYASFVRDQNLVVLDLATGAETRATTEGAGTVHFGEAEFVAQEEMHRTTGYWWSPDDRRIAVERFDEVPVGVVTRLAIGGEGTRIYEQRYPKAGTANALVELYVMAPDGSGRVKADLGAETDIYLARVDWTPDGKALLVQRQNRAQTRLDMLRVDPATGASELLFTERADSWVDLSDAYRPLADGSLIWWSARDGYGHLYRFADGKWTQLTKGPWEVASLAGVDEAKGRLFFLGNKDGVLERHLYAVDLAAPGVVTRLSAPGWWNEAVMDRAATRAIVTRSNADHPPQVLLADAAGKRLAWVSENAPTGDHPYAPFVASHAPTRFGTIAAADGSELHWSMMTPRLEPGRTYPVFVFHYGGPGSQVVANQWTGALYQYWVDRGWIVFRLDNRGSPNRGTAFADQIRHAMGSVEVADQIAGAKWLATQPYVDPQKIALYGWSYGGYMTLKLLEAAPGLYAGGVAGAPVSRWELYDTHYTERYMGDPRQVPDAYRRSDTLGDALNIADPLLIVHGMADDNVVLEHATVMLSKLQAGAKPFETMLYPGQTHRVAGPGVSVHLWRTIEAFLDRAVAKEAK
jgi:dipeptidyl-peptidase-4